MVGSDWVITAFSAVHSGLLHTGHTVSQEPQGLDWPLVVSIVLGLATVAVIAWVTYNQFIA